MTSFGRSVAENYEQWMVPLLFEPYACNLAERAARSAPERVLEIAAGTGALTRQLAMRLPDATIVATDLAPAMLERAAALGAARPVEWRAADAQALPFADASFDLVACQFGVMFFPDRVAAYREFHRVLRPGGRALVSTWDRLDTNVFAHEVNAAMSAQFPDDPPLFFARVPHGYFDHAVIRAELAAAGFGEPSIEEVVLLGHASGSEVPARALICGTPLRGEIEKRGALDDAIAAATMRIRARLGDGEIAAEMCAFVIDVQR